MPIKALQLRTEITSLTDFFIACNYQVKDVFMVDHYDAKERNQGKYLFAIEFTNSNEATNFRNYMKKNTRKLGRYGIISLQDHHGTDNKVIVDLGDMTQLLSYLPLSKSSMLDRKTLIKNAESLHSSGKEQVSTQYQRMRSVALEKAGENIECITEALDYLSINTTLFTEPDAQSYTNIIVNAGKNAIILAHAIHSLIQSIQKFKDKFTSEHTAGIYINALIKAGANVKYLADAFGYYFSESRKLYNEKLEQIYLNTLIAAGKNAFEVAGAFEYLQDRTILTHTYINALIAAGENAMEVAWGIECLHWNITLTQMYTDALIAAGKNAMAVAWGIRWLLMNRTSLTGSHAQNFLNVLIAAGKNASIFAIIITFSDPILSLLNRRDAQIYFNALIAAGENACDMIYVILNFNHNTLLTEPHAQANCEALAKAGKHLAGIKQLIIKLREYNNALITQANFNLIVKLDGDKARKIAEAIEALRNYSQNLVTQHNFNLLVHYENPQILVDFLTGKIQNINTLANAIITLSKESHFSKEAVRIFRGFDNHRKNTVLGIVKELVRSEVFTFKILERLIELDSEQLNILISAIESRQPDLLFLNEKASPVVLTIVSQITVSKLFKSLAVNARLVMPPPGDIESSYDDRLVKMSKERFKKLKNTFGNTLQLDEVELQIRTQLLNDIADEFEKDKRKDAAAFIRVNLLALAKRSDINLIKQALQYITSNTSSAQIAWRAYEPLAPWQEWPNLFTPPSDEKENVAVYSTRAASDGLGKEITQKTTSSHVREFAALCYLASCDTKLSEKECADIWADFKCYIAEVRRAHNSDNSIDNPSCFPGSLTRIALIVNKHPAFKQSEEIKGTDIPNLVDMKVKALIDTAFTEYCKDENNSQSDKALLYFALILIDMYDTNGIIENPEEVFTILSAAKKDDVNDDNLIQQAMKLRTDFLLKLITEKDVLLAISKHIKNHNISDEKLFYLVARALARIRTLGISLHESVLNIITAGENNISQNTQFEFEDAPFREVLDLEKLDKLFQSQSKFFSTSEKKEKAKLFNYYIPHYQRTLYFELKKAIPDLTTEIAKKIVEGIIQEEVADDTPEKEIKTLNDLDHALHHEAAEALAKEMRLDATLISKAIDATHQRLENRGADINVPQYSVAAA